MTLAAGCLAACGFVGDSFTQPARTRAVAVADLDGDGDMDAFLANAKNDIPPQDTVWLNDGAGTFRQRSQRLEQGVSLAVAAGDLDGDGDLDAMADTQGGAWVWVNDGLGVFTGGRFLSHSPDCAAAPGDVDGDGDLDLLAGCVDREVTVWLNDGAGDWTRRD